MDYVVIGNENHRFYADQAWPVMPEELKRLQRRRWRGAGCTRERSV